MQPSYQMPVEKKPWKQVLIRSVLLVVFCGLPALGIIIAFRLDAARYIVEARFVPFRFWYNQSSYQAQTYRPLLLLTEQVLMLLIVGLIARDWYGLTHSMPLLPRWMYGWGLVLGIALTLGMAFLWFIVIPFAG